MGWGNPQPFFFCHSATSAMLRGTIQSEWVMIALKQYFRRRQVKVDTVVDDNNIKIIRLEVGSWATNAYIIICPQTKDSVLIDTPPGAPTLVKNLKGTNTKYILLTHSHIDHYAGLAATRDRVQAPYAVHPKDNMSWLPFPPDIFLHNGSIFKVGNVKIETIYTPGHTPGSVSFRIGKYLIDGDTLFPGGPGRTISATRFQQIKRSITEKLFSLDDDTWVFPGHGQETTIKKAKAEYAVFASRPHDSKLHGDVVWMTS
jgi:hydroxyacylglutathione hydrolase